MVQLNGKLTTIIRFVATRNEINWNKEKKTRDKRKRKSQNQSTLPEYV